MKRQKREQRQNERKRKRERQKTKRGEENFFFFEKLKIFIHKNHYVCVNKMRRSRGMEKNHC